MYYKERIQPHVEETLQSTDHKGKIMVIQKVTNEMWENEDEETKVAVRTRMVEIAALKQKTGPRTPEQYQV
jgi:hypothetical protein